MSGIWTGTFMPGNVSVPPWRAPFNPLSVICSYLLQHSITNTVWLSVATSKPHGGEIRASSSGGGIKQNLSFLFQCMSKIIDGKWNDLPPFNKQGGASVCAGADDVDPRRRSVYLKTVITLFCLKIIKPIKTAQTSRWSGCRGPIYTVTVPHSSFCTQTFFPPHTQMVAITSSAWIHIQSSMCTLSSK